MEKRYFRVSQGAYQKMWLGYEFPEILREALYLAYLPGMRYIRECDADAGPRWAEGIFEYSDSGHACLSADWDSSG